MNFLLIGRSNVGKSSIYNILTGFNSNIIHKDSGTTRDWHQERFKKIPEFIIFDSPGLLLNNKKKKSFQTTLIFKNLLKKIDSFFYVIDYSSIFDVLDKKLIDELRKFNKEIILFINKFDNYNQIPNNDFYKYGIKNYFFLSCSHNYGFDLINNYLKNRETSKIKNNLIIHDFSIAIFGKPNTGKSTLLNSFLGFNRFTTGSIPGTTSDFVKEYFTYKDCVIKVIDTAGISKKSIILSKSINYYSIQKSLQKIAEVGAAMIIIDSSEGLDRQDKRIINIVSNKARNIIIIFNKIDLIEKKENFIKETLQEIDNTLHEIKNIKVFFCSAFSKRHVNKILSYLFENIIIKKYFISTGNINKWLKKVVLRKSHPLIENKKVNFKYAVKINENPVTIKIYSNFASKIKNEYRRYLINNFNKKFRIINQKTRLVFTSAKNPYL
jgi:GTP-binding protein